MSNLVFLHAHPDDESSQTAGAMARAAAQGHRVVVVFATTGEHGEVPDDLAEGETLADRRRAEASRAAEILGLARVAWLGYVDSGMTGWQQNSEPGSFHLADPDEAGRRLAEILDEEDADFLVTYDWHGGYGHPDHVQAHRVGHRGAELAARTPRLLESTMNRDVLRAFREAAVAAGEQVDLDPDQPMDDGNPFGEPADAIHWQVDVLAFIEHKRAAMQAHASQVTDIGSFMAMPRPVFDLAFGTEWYIEPGRTQPLTIGWPFTQTHPGAPGSADPSATRP